MTQVPFTCSGGTITSLTLGQDGNFWITESDAWDPTTQAYTDSGFVARLTAEGDVTPFPLTLDGLAVYSFPATILSEPDGRLWFLQSGNATLDSVTTDGAITKYGMKWPYKTSLPTLMPWGMAVGLEGKTLWFVGDDAFGSFLPPDLDGPAAGDGGARDWV